MVQVELYKLGNGQPRTTSFRTCIIPVAIATKRYTLTWTFDFLFLAKNSICIVILCTEKRVQVLFALVQWKDLFEPPLLNCTQCTFAPVIVLMRTLCTFLQGTASLNIL